MNTATRSLVHVYIYRIFIPILAAVLMFFPLFEKVHAAQIPPQILTYQGRLTDSGGNLLGGVGTTYYFKFSIWNNPTVGSGTRVWPTTAPTSIGATVKQGVFTINIGDTTNGYPDALNLDFSSSPNFYLQVEASSNNSTFETLSPRQQLTSAAFAQIVGAVVGTTTPSVFGTTTPATNSFVTISATSSDSIPLSIVAALNQVANLFQIQNSANENLFSINASGGISAIAATTTSLFSTTASSTNLFTSNLSIGSLSGFLKATAGAVATALVNLASDVTGILPIGNGGTGTSTAPAYGQLLVGNASGGYTFTATSSLGIQSSLAFTYPLTNIADTIALAFSTTTSNTWAGTQTFTNVPTFSSLTSTGLAVNALGVVYGAATTTFNVPLSYAGGAVSLPAANASTNGYLASGDWTTFNNKVSSTSLSASAPLAYNSGTGAFTLGTVGVANGGTGLTSYTTGDLLYASGLTTLAGTSTANLKTTLALNNVENTALSTWAGSTNLITLGTITSGTWNAGALTSSGALTVNGTGNSYFAGNVGIGTTSPYAKLSVVGETVSSYFTATSTTATSTFGGDIKIASSTSALYANNTWYAKSGVALGASAVGFSFDTVNDFANGTLGSKNFVIKNFGTEEFAIGEYNAGDSVLWGRGLKIPIHVSIGETATPVANSILSVSGTVEGNANGVILGIGLKPTGAFQTGAAFRMVATVQTGGVLPFFSGIQAILKNSGNAAWGSTIGTLSPYVVQAGLQSTAGSSGMSNWVSSFQAVKGSYSGGIPNVWLAYEAHQETKAGIESIGFYDFGNDYSAVLLGNSYFSGTLKLGDQVGVRSYATALLELGAGSTAAQSAPLKFNSGALMTTPEAGAVEYLSNRFYIRGSDGLSVNGNVGIGTTSPYAKLSVVGETVSSYFTATSTTATSTFMGAVGIGTSTPWRTLSVTGTVAFSGITSAIGAGSLCLTSANDVTYNSGSDACLSSLRETKHDINNLTVSGLDTLDALQPVSFVYNTDIVPDGRTRYGFVAEDTAVVDRHLTSYDAKGALSGIDDRAIISVAVRAIQELNAKFSVPADATTTMPSAVLTADGKGIDLYKLATYTLSGMEALAARVDAQNIRLTSLEARIASLENASITTSDISATSILSSLGAWTDSLSTALKEEVTAAYESIGSGKIFAAAAGVFDKMFAREVHTDTLCVGTTCVTQEQFLEMVQSSSMVQPNSVTAPVVPTAADIPHIDETVLTNATDTVPLVATATSTVDIPAPPDVTTVLTDSLQEVIASTTPPPSPDVTTETTSTQAP